MNLGKRAVWFLLLGVLSACAGVPIQEMSDARQAIYSARMALEQEPESQAIQEAETLLREAEQRLRAGEYSVARRMAAEAKMMAIRARQIKTP